MTDVLYSLIRRADYPAGGYYWLLRLEGGESEILCQGAGLQTRLRIVSFLREVAELDGPDAPAALLAMRRGWSVGSVAGPPAGSR